MRYIVIPLILIVACSKAKESKKSGDSSKPVPEGFANSLDPTDVPAMRSQARQLSKELTESVFGQVIQADKLPAALDLSVTLDMVDTNIVNESVCAGHVRKVLGLSLSSFTTIEGFKKDDGKISNLFDDAKRDARTTKMDDASPYAVGFKSDESNLEYQDKYKKEGFLYSLFGGSTAEFVYVSFANFTLTPKIVDVASASIGDNFEQTIKYELGKKTIRVNRKTSKAFLAPGGVSTGQGTSESSSEILSENSLEFNSTSTGVTKSETTTHIKLTSSAGQLLVEMSEATGKDDDAEVTNKKTRIVRSEKGECSVE